MRTLSNEAEAATQRYLSLGPHSVADQDLSIMRRELQELLHIREQEDSAVPPAIPPVPSELDPLVLGGILGGVEHELARRGLQNERWRQEQKQEDRERIDEGKRRRPKPWWRFW